MTNCFQWGGYCSEAHRLNKKAAACILRAVAKHSPPLSQAVVNCGAIQPLISILAEFDPAVKEVAAGACGQIARHTPQLSQYLVDTGVITPLFLAIQVSDSLSVMHVLLCTKFCTSILMSIPP